MASSGASSRTRKPPPSNSPRQDSWQKNVLCKYYMDGMCSRGQECAWSHDRNMSNKKTIPCKYYSHGTCANGDNCRFSHGQQVPPLNPNAPEYKASKSDPQKAPWSEIGATVARLEITPKATTSRSWADAPEFVPKAVKEADKGPKTWAQIVDPQMTIDLPIDDAESQLCPYSMVGECRYGEHCDYVHGLICEMCGSPLLHPNHQRQRDRHRRLCLEQHEADMELAFAVKQSKERTCGICMEVVIDKKPSSEARFGIMPNCVHCYCLACLRKWRQAKQFENEIVRACPECRTKSDYIVPSKYWIETKEEKDKLLTSYKAELNKKQCKYFNKGKGQCPFGNKCFYRHEDAKGKPVDVGPPEGQKRRVYQIDDDYDDVVEMQRVMLQDFLELARESGRGFENASAEQLLDMLDLFIEEGGDLI